MEFLFLNDLKEICDISVLFLLLTKIQTDIDQ